MYRIESKLDAVKEIQKYLIATTEEDVAVVPNGIYNAETRAAVQKFQASASLPVTGAVDYETFSLLYKSYKGAILKDDIRKKYPQMKFPVKLGDYGREIFKINEVMRLFLIGNGDSVILRGGFAFSEESEKSVRRIREILKLPEGSSVDEEFYYRVEKDNNLRFLFEQK